MILISTTATTFQSCAVASTVLSSSTVGTIAKSILKILTSKLGITSGQSGLVSNALTGFLTSKANIMSLAKSDPTGYASKFGDIQGTLMSGLKGALNAGQMTSLMNLKPTTNDAKNVLSNLFY